tara:strand:- start:439 stop:621 length:183 start_codon:yes stop_codon:yes gene_type:complete
MKGRIIRNGPPRQEETKACSSSLCCKATASLEKEVAEELNKEDKGLEEIINAGTTTQEQD